MYNLKFKTERELHSRFERAAVVHNELIDKWYHNEKINHKEVVYSIVDRLMIVSQWVNAEKYNAEHIENRLLVDDGYFLKVGIRLLPTEVLGTYTSSQISKLKLIGEEVVLNKAAIRVTDDKHLDNYIEWLFYDTMVCLEYGYGMLYEMKDNYMNRIDIREVEDLRGKVIRIIQKALKEYEQKDIHNNYAGVRKIIKLTTEYAAVIKAAGKGKLKVNIVRIEQGKWVGLWNSIYKELEVVANRDKIEEWLSDAFRKMLIIGQGEDLLVYDMYDKNNVVERVLRKGIVKYLRDNKDIKRISIRYHEDLSVLVSGNSLIVGKRHYSREKLYILLEALEEKI